MSKRNNFLKAFAFFVLIDAVLIAAVYAGYRYYKATPTEDADPVRVQMLELSKAIDLYYQDCKTFPSEDQGLSALQQAPTGEPVCPSWDGPYLPDAQMKDPWGHLFVYGRDGDFYWLKSFGADGKPGGNGDDSDYALD